MKRCFTQRLVSLLGMVLLVALVPSAKPALAAPMESGAESVCVNHPQQSGGLADLIKAEEDDLRNLFNAARPSLGDTIIPRMRVQYGGTAARMPVRTDYLKHLQTVQYLIAAGAALMDRSKYYGYMLIIPASTLQTPYCPGGTPYNVRWQCCNCS